MLSPDSPELESEGPGPLSSLGKKRFAVIARIQVAKIATESDYRYAYRSYTVHLHYVELGKTVQRKKWTIYPDSTLDCAKVLIFGKSFGKHLQSYTVHTSTIYILILMRQLRLSESSAPSCRSWKRNMGT